MAVAMWREEEFMSRLEQDHYDCSSPLSRFFINRMRRREGLPPLRVSRPRRA